MKNPANQEIFTRFRLTISHIRAMVTCGAGENGASDISIWFSGN